MAKFFWQRTKDETSGEEKFALPEEMEKQLAAGAKAAEELPKITQLLADLKSTQESKEVAEKKTRDDAAAAAARKKAEETNGTLEEQIEALMLEGKTKEAVKLATQDQAAVLMTLRADNVKRELFEDAEKFKYYHGDIKREVDELLSGQSLTLRNDPASVANCYHTIIGKHANEILEGKIKTRFAGSESGSRGTSSGSAGSGDKKELKITDDVKKLAQQFGVKPEDYAEMLEQEGIGY